MKISHFAFGLLLSAVFSPTAYNQDCEDALKSISYKMSVPESNQTYSKSRSAFKEIEVRKTNEFKIVFSGHKKYFMGIITEAAYEPVHIRMIGASNNVIYDNISNKYAGFVDFYIEKTQAVTVEITILATDAPATLTKDFPVCLGIKILSLSM